MDIVTFLRQMRFLLSAVKQLIPAHEQAKIIMKTEYIAIETPDIEDKAM